MANQILLSVNKTHISVAPGASVDLGVTAQNLTTLVDQVAVRAEGIAPTWVQAIPAYLPVFAQGQATARLVIQPPRDPAQAVAGIYPLRVRGASQEYPGQEGDAASELEIQLVGDYHFWLESSTAQDRQENAFTVKVENNANAPLRLQFKGSDDAAALLYKFDPFQLDVPPGGQATGVLTVRAKSAATSERAIPFTLIAQGEFTPQGEPSITAPMHQIAGQFVQAAPARLTISIQPPQIENDARGAYLVRLGNPGAAPAAVRLVGSNGNNLLFDFQPDQVVLPPQSETSIHLVVRPTVALPISVREPKEFQITAQAADGETQPVSTQATFIQVGTVTPEAARPFPWWIVVVPILVVFLLVLIVMSMLVLGILR